MTPAQAQKISLPRAKIEAGIPIKDSEWPAWMRGPRKLTDVDNRDEHQLRAEYLYNKGITEDQANPAAIHWDAYYAREKGI